MTNQIETLWTMQIAYCEGWAKIFRDSFSAYETLIQRQAKMFQHPAYFRYADMIPHGADWFDHYGQRNHDVDVTHI